MTPRTGLYVALVRLVIAVLCGIAALIIPELANGPPENHWENINGTAVVLVYVGLFIGFIVMLVGLAMAVAGTVMKPS
jgi:type III secretory pathway component EscT